LATGAMSLVMKLVISLTLRAPDEGSLIEVDNGLEAGGVGAAELRITKVARKKVAMDERMAGGVMMKWGKCSRIAVG